MQVSVDDLICDYYKPLDQCLIHKVRKLLYD